MPSLIDSPRVELDSGGMARVFLVLQPAPQGTSPRVVAVKEMHPHLARDRDHHMRFLDEARITSRVRHPNVVEVLELVQERDGLRIVMEYVHGASLSELSKQLVQRGERMPPGHASAVLSGILAGLHAAHEAKTETGEPLQVVHRDVTPRNVLVGIDGVPRLIDFGIARAALRDAPATRTGGARGTPFYMAPEQLGSGIITRQTDIFLAGLLLWELLTGRKISNEVQSEGQFLLMLAEGRMPSAHKYVPDLSPALSQVLDRALASEPADRFGSAAGMAKALSSALPPSPAAALGAWVMDIAAGPLARRNALVVALQRGITLEQGDEPDGPVNLSSSTQTESSPPSAWPRRTETISQPPSTRLDVEPKTTLMTGRAPLESPAVPRRRAALPIIAGVAAVALLSGVALLALRSDERSAGEELPPATASSAPSPLEAPPPVSMASPLPVEAMPASSGGPVAPVAPIPLQDRSARPAAPLPPPARKLGCTYRDDKKITRVVSCSNAECVRRGRACKPVEQR